MKIIGIILIIILVLLVLYIYFKFFKRIKLRNIVFIDGTLGSGKTALTINLAIRQYKHNLRITKIKNKICFWKEPQELPKLYSNIKLKKIEYTPLTKELITRQNYRFAYKSVVIWDEISLSISQMDFNDKILNERLTEFFKLFRHETKGGYLICNSQAINDIHYSLRYILTDYIYIYRKTPKIVPLINIFWLEERTYCADNSSITTKDTDIEESLKMYVTGKRYFKKYDTYCHSIFTDKLPIYQKNIYLEKDKSLKSDFLLSYKEILFIYENYTEEEIKKLPKYAREEINKIKLNVKAYEIEQQKKLEKKLGGKTC